MRIHSTKGFSLMEILVAAILLAIIMGGLANIFFAAKRWLMHSQFKMTGGQLGKYFLEPLASQVKQSDWDTAGGDYLVSNPLYIHSGPGAAVSAGGKTYTPDYNVGLVPAPGVGSTSPPQMRKVTVGITWPED